MNILVVHNRYQFRGGEDECYEEEVFSLRKNGHFVNCYEKNNDNISDLSSLDLAMRTIWSQDTFSSIRSELKSKPYDLVHVHNFLPLVSPSIYYAAHSQNIPIVQTLHNYRLLCPNGLFLRGGQPCEDCLGKDIPWPGVLHKCYRDNRLATAAVASMISSHRLFSTWSKQVDAYIVLTEFARSKFVQGGIPKDKIFIKPNFVSNDTGVGNGAEQYAIFVGRLSKEKGLDTLIKAWTQFAIGLPLKIVGDGPLAKTVCQAAQSNSVIEFLGRRPLEEVYSLIGGATALIFPSEWYEGMPRVIIESFCKGTPVIASKIGAIEEIVDHQRTGLHFTPGNAEDLARQIDWALSHEIELAAMRQAARAEFEAKYTAEANYIRLMEIYNSVTKRSSVAV